MSNTVGVPPDIASQMSQQGQRGIGGGAAQNAKTVQQRNAAMNPTLAAEQKALAEKEAEAAPASEDDKPEEIQACPNAKCRIEVQDKWNYCPQCKTDLLRGGPAKKLGIVFTEDDMHDYIFKGFVVKEVTVMGRIKLIMKSGQPIDLKEVDDYIMNGSWGKTDDGDERKISDFYMRQINLMCGTASVIMKVDGESIGETLADRMKWLQERGSSFVDILSTRVSLFVQALSEHLEKEDTLSGS